MWDNVSVGDSSYSHRLMHLKLPGNQATTAKYGQSNLCFLDQFGTLLSCSATFLPEVSEPVLEVKNVTTINFWRYSSKSKKKERDQRDLNISEKFETLLPCSTIYFLVMRARLLQKLATRNFSIGKNRSRFTIFEGRILK